MSLLHLCIFFNNFKGFNVLLGLEKNLEKWGSDDNNETVLHLACEVPRYLYFLCENGEFTNAYLNKKNKKGKSVFQSICGTVNGSLVKKLLKRKNLQIESKCYEGNTPFIASIASNNIITAGHLYEKHANIQHQNKKGNTALHIACMKNVFLGVLQLLEWKANINIKNNFGITPLCYAVMKDHRKIVHLLLTHSADVNVVDENGWTVLHHAVKRDNIEVLQTLLKNNADFNVMNKRQQTPLMMAFSLGKKDAIKCLTRFPLS